MQTEIDLRSSVSHVLVQFVQPSRKMFERKLPIQKQWENRIENKIEDEQLFASVIKRFEMLFRYFVFHWYNRAKSVV